jgi:outer membrane protein OmpA-like peptidoglycan-associated protein
MLKKLLAVAAVAFLLGACETPAPPPPPPAPPPVRNFLVFFDFDKSSLTPRAMDIVKEAANVAKAGQNARVTCTGHTDTAGPAAYNMALSLRRANTVKQALVREGVAAEAITVIGRGEEQLLVATGDGVREPQNRRVEIVIQ